MKLLKQNLCRLCFRPFVLLLAAGSLAASMAAAQPQTGTQSVAVTDGAQSLQSQVVGWAASKAGKDPARVEMLPLDPRMPVKTCDQPLQLDTPFTSLETVRVRCAKPAWQLYVRVAFDDGPPTAPVAVEPAKVTVPSRKVLVAGVSLQRGTALTPDLVKWAEFDAALPGPQALERLADIENMELAREVRSGVPIRSFDLRPIVLIRRGESVLMQIGQGRGFSITARLEALQDGRMGEQIRLRNLESGRQLSGVVVAKDTVRGL